MGSEGGERSRPETDVDAQPVELTSPRGVYRGRDSFIGKLSFILFVKTGAVKDEGRVAQRDAGVRCLRERERRFKFVRLPGLIRCKSSRYLPSGAPIR